MTSTILCLECRDETPNRDDGKCTGCQAIFCARDLPFECTTCRCSARARCVEEDEDFQACTKCARPACTKTAVCSRSCANPWCCAIVCSKCITLDVIGCDDCRDTLCAFVQELQDARASARRLQLTDVNDSTSRLELDSEVVTLSECIELLRQRLDDQ